MKTILNIFICLTLSGLASCQEARTVKVTVTEEDGTPIEGAKVIVTFLGYSGKDTHRASGETNAGGAYQATGNPPLRMSVRLEKQGYYTTRSGRLSRQKDHDLTFILRKVKNPIPLYAKKVSLGVPVNQKWLGFDFELGDWVAPYGRGKVSDMMVRCDTQVTGEREGRGKCPLNR